MSSQRDQIKQLSPPWLADGNAEKFLYVLGLASDALLDKMDQGVKARMPGAGTPTALPYIGLDRVMTQGPAETNAQFVARLQNALPAWAMAGSRAAILSQVQAYLTGVQPGVAAALPECLIVGGNSTSTTWDSLYISTPQGAPPAHTIVSPVNWNWDGTYQPWREWLVLFFASVATGQSGTGATISSIGGSGVTGVTSGFATLTGMSTLNSTNVNQYLTITSAAHSVNNGFFQITSVASATSCIIANPAAVSGDTFNWSISQFPFIGPGPVWGSPSHNWGSANTWGLSVSPQVVASIRNILKTWKSARAYYPYFICSFGGGDSSAGKEFSPNSSAGGGNPNGTFGDYGHLSAGVWVANKQAQSSFDAYPMGTGQYFQSTVQNVT